MDELGSGLDLSIVGGSVGYLDFDQDKINLHRIEDSDGTRKYMLKVWLFARERVCVRVRERESTLFPTPAPYSSFSLSLSVLQFQLEVGQQLPSWA